MNIYGHNRHAQDAAAEAIDAILLARRIIANAATALVRKEDDDEQGAYFANELQHVMHAMTAEASRLSKLGKERDE